MTKTNIRLAIAVGVLVGLLGCRATVPAVPVETVGQLAPSYRSIATAPVHATTDLTPGFQAIDTDADDAPSFKAVDEGAETPEVSAKTDGVTVGSVRQ